MNTEEESNCAFQYAKMDSGLFISNTRIVCDKSGITLSEAKSLWNQYYHDCASHINNGGTTEMVIWINMPDDHSYGDTLEYISTDAESDGELIWETKKTFFTKRF